MDPDRVIYSMVLGWILLCAALIALDWLGNPNRGSFRPKGDRSLRDRRMRKADRMRNRLENDAAVRATLRDAYGASSMRLSWSGDREEQARRLDDALVVRDLDERTGVVEVGSRELTPIDYTRTEGDPLPNITEEEWPTPDETVETEQPEDAETVELEPLIDETASEPEPERAVGWRVGGHPLSLTARGDEPNPTTIRARVWKNVGALGAWDEDNRERVRAGKPPRRRNPVTGREERGIVDLESGTTTWGNEPVDPFGDDG
jgi:hypothetical protein